MSEAKLEGSEDACDLAEQFGQVRDVKPGMEHLKQ